MNVVEREPPAGFRWKWVPDEDWTTDPRVIGYRRCRYGAGPGKRACGERAVAALRRSLHREGHGNVGAWWCYCADHLYGRRLEDGIVLSRRLVPAKLERSE